MSIRRDLLVTGALVLAGLIIVSGRGGSVATLLAGLLVLFLPGYAMACAMSPRGGTAASEQILFAIGLSLVATVLGAIVLNLTPLGVRPLGWSIFLGGLALGGLGIAVLRRGREGSGHRARVTVEPLPALLFAVAFCVAIGAGVAARAGSDRDPTGSVTQLWLLISPPPDKGELKVGLRATEGGQYRLEIWRGEKKSREWTFISLSPGEFWRETLPVPAGSGPVEGRLYAPDASGRAMRLVSVTPPSG